MSLGFGLRSRPEASDRGAGILRRSEPWPERPAPKVGERKVAAGGIVLAAVMLLVIPVLIMFGGAIWSALFGWLLVDDADHRAEAPNPSTSE